MAKRQRHESERPLNFEADNVYLDPLQAAAVIRYMAEAAGDDGDEVVERWNDARSRKGRGMLTVEGAE